MYIHISHYVCIITIWKTLFLFYSDLKKKTICLIESTDKKLINVELALLFNETCKKYMYIYTCTQSLYLERKIKYSRTLVHLWEALCGSRQNTQPSLQQKKRCRNFLLVYIFVSLLVYISRWTKLFYTLTSLTYHRYRLFIIYMKILHVAPEKLRIYC